MVASPKAKLFKLHNKLNNKFVRQLCRNIQIFERQVFNQWDVIREQNAKHMFVYWIFNMLLACQFRGTPREAMTQPHGGGRGRLNLPLLLIRLDYDYNFRNREMALYTPVPLYQRVGGFIRQFTAGWIFIRSIIIVKIFI